MFYGEPFELDISFSAKDGVKSELVQKTRLILSSVFQTGEIHKAFHYVDLDLKQLMDKVKINFKDYEGCLAPDGGCAIRADVMAKGKDDDGKEYTFGNHCRFHLKERGDCLAIQVRFLTIFFDFFVKISMFQES